MRRLLFISEGVACPSESDVERVLSTSLALSAMRCIFTYMIMPVLVPTIGALAGAGPVIGALLSALALVFNVRAVRTFWQAADSRRWAMSALYLFITLFVIYLLALDLTRVRL